MSKKIAVIGAGISGTNLSRKLVEAGADLTLFEKARGPGGRSSSRRFSYKDKDYNIDHGAQFIDVSNPEFQSFIDELVSKNVVEEIEQEQKFKGFQGRTFIPVPAMNAVAKYLSEGINARYSVRPDHLVKEAKGLRLIEESGEDLGLYDFVISTAPPKQTADLFKGIGEFDPLAALEMKPHFAIMLASEKKYDFEFNEFNVEKSILNWIGINSKKPGRANEPLSIIMHTDFLWSLKNKEMDFDEVTKLALAELERITGFSDEEPIYQACHRWLYGRTLEPLQVEFIFDRKNNIGCCGDYMLGDNIESAYISSTRLAERIATLL